MLNILRKNGGLSLFLGACLLSTNGIFVKILAQHMPTTNIVAIRFIGAVTVLSVIARVLGKKISTKNIKVEIILGFLTGATILSYFTAIPSVGLSLSIVLLYTAPFFAAIMSWPLLSEKLEKKDIICILASFAGILLIVKPGLSSDPMMFIALLAGFFYGMKMVCNRFLGLRDSTWTMTFYALLVPAIFSVGYIGFNFQSFPTPTLEEALLLGGLILIPTVAGFLLEHNGFKSISVSNGSTIMMSEVLIASLWGFLFFSETLDIQSLVGGALVVISGVALNTNIKPNK